MTRNRVATGRAGEDAAARFLVLEGYRILERNVRFRIGEIDLVAEEGGTLAFVEVKTRSGSRFGTAVEAITPAKQRQLVRVALLYLSNRGWSERACRFDVVAVSPGVKGEWVCTLYRNAFAAG